MVFTINSSDPQNEGDVYILGTGKAASKALEIQHQLLAKDSYDRLVKAGLSLGQTVWDIGCGSGVMTEYLAKGVGETGHVYAMDVSSEQISVSKNRIEHAGLKNVTFIQGEITSIENFPIGKADIVYARLVLMHLVNPKIALKKMRLLLKSGGVIALQESIMSSGYASVKNDVIEEYMKTLIALGKCKGVDFDIGIKLRELCQEAGFSRINAYCLQHRFSSQQTKHLLLDRSIEWEDKAIKANLITKERTNQWRAAIQTLLESDPSFYYCAKQAYILAWNES